MSAYYPVFLDIRDRLCLVIGGGDIGSEKSLNLLEYGAKVLIISPNINENLKHLIDGKQLMWRPRKYRIGDLKGAFIAILADTKDDQMNKDVSNEAFQKNIPLNVVDVTDLCTWIAPAISRKGDFVVAASTGGESPAIARKFREELSNQSIIRPKRNIMYLGDILPIVAEARREIRQLGIKIQPDHWQACLTEEFIELVQNGDKEKAKTQLMENLFTGMECECQYGKCKMWVKN